MSRFNLLCFEISWNINCDTSPSSASYSESPRSFKLGVTGAELPMRDERAIGLNSVIRSGGREYSSLGKKAKLRSNGTAVVTACYQQRCSQ